MITQINPNQISGYLRPDQGASAPEAYLHTQITGSEVDAPEIANRPNIRVFRNGVLQTEGELYDYVRQGAVEDSGTAAASSGTLLLFHHPLSSEERLTVEIYSDTAAPKPLTAGSGIKISEDGEISVRTDGVTAAIDSQNRICVSGVPQDVLPGFATYDSAGLVRPDYDTCIVSNGLLIVKGAGSGGSGGSGGGSTIHYIGGNGISIAGNIIRARADNSTIGFNGGALSGLYSGVSGISVSHGVISASVDNSTIKISGGQISGGYVGSGGIVVSRNVISAAVDNETIKVSNGKLVAVGGSGGSSVAYKAGDGIAIASSGSSSGTISVRADESTISVSGGVLSGVYEGGSGIQISGGIVAARVDGVTVGFDSTGALSAAGSGGIVSVGPGLVLNDGIASAAPDGVTIGINESGELTGMYSGTSGIGVNGGEISVLTDGVTLVPGENGVLSGGYQGTSGVAVSGAVVSAKYDDRTVGVNSSGQLYVKTIPSGVYVVGNGFNLRPLESSVASALDLSHSALAMVNQIYVHSGGNKVTITDSEGGSVTGNPVSGSGDPGVDTTKPHISNGANGRKKVTTDSGSFIEYPETDSSTGDYTGIWIRKYYDTSGNIIRTSRTNYNGESSQLQYNSAGEITGFTDSYVDNDGIPSYYYRQAIQDAGTYEQRVEANCIDEAVSGVYGDRSMYANTTTSYDPNDGVKIASLLTLAYNMEQSARKELATAEGNFVSISNNASIAREANMPNMTLTEIGADADKMGLANYFGDALHYRAKFNGQQNLIKVLTSGMGNFINWSYGWNGVFDELDSINRSDKETKLKFSKTNSRSKGTSSQPTTSDAQVGIGFDADANNANSNPQPFLNVLGSSYIFQTDKDAFAVQYSNPANTNKNGVLQVSTNDLYLGLKDVTSAGTDYTGLLINRNGITGNPVFNNAMVVGLQGGKVVTGDNKTEPGIYFYNGVPYISFEGILFSGRITETIEADTTPVTISDESEDSDPQPPVSQIIRKLEFYEVKTDVQQAK